MCSGSAAPTTWLVFLDSRRLLLLLAFCTSQQEGRRPRRNLEYATKQFCDINPNLPKTQFPLQDNENRYTYIIRL